MTSLEPCPFCGGEAMIIHPSNADHFGYLHSAVCCTKEGCRGEQFDTWYGTEEEAIEVWNQRYKRTCKWLRDGDSIINMCSACGALFALDEWDVSIFKHCPNCGAEVVK